MKPLQTQRVRPRVRACAEALRIALSRLPGSLPLYVAQQRGFFDDCPASLDCLRRLTMDREIRWPRREGHVAAGPHPNALSLVHAEPLRSVKPSSVGLPS